MRRSRSDRNTSTAQQIVIRQDNVQSHVAMGGFQSKANWNRM